jgi:hypothetical protein
MKLKKILLVASIGAAAFSATILYAENTNPTQQQQTKEQNLEIKSLMISNIDSLFPFQTQITIGKVEKNSDGNIVASNILVMSGGKDKPNLSINSMEFTGLDFGGNVDKDFTIKTKGLSITNLATSIASSNVVSASVDSKSLANNEGLYSVIMNSFSQSLYDFTLEYNYQNETLELDVDATYSKKKFLDEKVKLSDVKLAGNAIDEDFLAGFKNIILNSKLVQAEFDANFTEMMKQVTTQYLGKDYKNIPSLNIKGNLGKVKGQLNLDVNGKLGNNNHLNYDLAVADIDLDHSIEDIIENDADALKNAYIKSNNADLKINIDFKEKSYPKDQFMQKLFKFVGKDDVNLLITLNYQLKGSIYNSNLQISGGDLASIDTSSKGTINGKLKVLPYLNMATASNNESLYDCKDQLCLNDLNVSISNTGLLEKVARYTNNDPNTSPSQILGSYGALLQLFAVQQDDKFIQEGLSFLSIFLQNPKNISVTLDAKKPINENALFAMLVSDAENMKKHNPMQGGKVNLKANPDLKLLNNIQKLFKVDFEVNK